MASGVVEAASWGVPTTESGRKNGAEGHEKTEAKTCSAPEWPAAREAQWACARRRARERCRWSSKPSSSWRPVVWPRTATHRQQNAPCDGIWEKAGGKAVETVRETSEEEEEEKEEEILLFSPKDDDDDEEEEEEEFDDEKDDEEEDEEE